MKKTVIFGAGKVADVVYYYMANESPRKVAGFTCDDEHVNGDSYHDLPLVPLSSVVERFPPDEHDMFVALVNKEPAGRCALYQVGDLAHVRDLTVLPEYADRGVERTLLAHVLTLAKRLELGKVMAHVAKDDAVRLARFHHAGFVPAGEIEEFRRDPVVIPDSAA